MEREIELVKMPLKGLYNTKSVSFFLLTTSNLPEKFDQFNIVENGF